MEKEKWDMLEYEQIHGELNNRINFLHNSINLAVIFWLILLIMSFLFMAMGMPQDMFITFLLLIPIIMDLLCFNYQSSQNSLESIARYNQYHLKPRLEEKYKTQDILGWEKFFATDKEPFKIESSTKVFPFILPSIIPLYFLFAHTPLQPLQIAILVTDLVFLAIILVIFRYKLRRVK
jgi:hypothetical protein